MKKDVAATRWNERPADQALHEIYLSTAKWNESYYKDEKLDAMLGDARRELDFDKRKALAHLRRPPPLTYLPDVQPWSSRFFRDSVCWFLQDYYPAPLQQYRLIQNPRVRQHFQQRLYLQAFESGVFRWCHGRQEQHGQPVFEDCQLFFRPE